MKSYLTDCPHREKLTWLEQTHLIAPGLLYNFDLQNHFMLGGIEEWFFAGFGGIRILHEDLNFGEVKISPYVDSKLE